MPQHPKYSNSHQKNLDDLYNVLLGLEKFGLIHEEFYQPIDRLMVELHPEAFRRYESACNPGCEPDDEDFEPAFDPSVSVLFEYIEQEDQAQFIQDFRNVVGHLLYSGSWDTEGVAQQIIEARDLDYLKIHTFVDSDPDAQEQFRWQPRSSWFSSDILPMRAGIYEVSSLGHQDPKLCGYSYWDGKFWYDKCVLFKDCVSQLRTKENRATWGYCWRGITKQPV